MPWEEPGESWQVPGESDPRPPGKAARGEPRSAGPFTAPCRPSRPTAAARPGRRDEKRWGRRRGPLLAQLRAELQGFRREEQPLMPPPQSRSHPAAGLGSGLSRRTAPGLAAALVRRVAHPAALAGGCNR